MSIENLPEGRKRAMYMYMYIMIIGLVEHLFSVCLKLYILLKFVEQIVTSFKKKTITKRRNCNWFQEEEKEKKSV